jgi:general L-amino acid transport system substrate-binding protein
MRVRSALTTIESKGLVLRFLLLVLLAILHVSSAHAGAVLDRIKREGVIRCGGEPRPGLVSVKPDGRASGLYLDLCRAIGAAVLPPTGRIEFHQYDSSKAYDAVRNGTDDLSFLSAGEIVEEELAGKVLPGPAVFHATTAVMVAESSPVRQIADLAGQPICFSLAANAHRHLEAWFAAHELDFVRMGYQEDVELQDAYNVQVCRAFAAEATTLAEARLDGGVNKLKSRILPEPLAAFPIFAATGTQDGEWAAVVAWAIHTLMRAEIPAAKWSAGGLDSLPIEASPLHLDKDWQSRVIGAAGSYADIYRRNLGEDSPYKLPRGVNAGWRDGGLLIVPHLD